MGILITVIVTFALSPFLFLLLSGLMFWLGKATKFEFLMNYGYLIAYSMDQLFNTLLLGAPDQTISQRTALALDSGRAKWFVRPLAWLIDVLAVLVANDHNHVKESIVDVSGNRELWSWKKPQEGKWLG